MVFVVYSFVDFGFILLIVWKVLISCQNNNQANINYSGAIHALQRQATIAQDALFQGRLYVSKMGIITLKPQKSKNEEHVFRDKKTEKLA